jgi:hypothetical protein
MVQASGSGMLLPLAGAVLVVFVDVWAKATATERILRIKTTGILDFMTSPPSANG